MGSEPGDSFGSVGPWGENSDYAPSEDPCDDDRSQCSGPAEEGDCEWEVVPIDAEELQEEPDDELEDITDLQAGTEFEDGNDAEDEDEDAADADDEDEEPEEREVVGVEIGNETNVATADRLCEDNVALGAVGQASDPGG